MGYPVDQFSTAPGALVSKPDETSTKSLSRMGYFQPGSRDDLCRLAQHVGGEETVIWGVIITIAGALGVFAMFLLA